MDRVLRHLAWTMAEGAATVSHVFSFEMIIMANVSGESVLGPELGTWHCSPLTGGKTETLRGDVTCLRPHRSWQEGP